MLVFKLDSKTWEFCEFSCQDKIFMQVPLGEIKRKQSVFFFSWLSTLRSCTAVLRGSQECAKDTVMVVVIRAAVVVVVVVVVVVAVVAG